MCARASRLEAVPRRHDKSEGLLQLTTPEGYYPPTSVGKSMTPKCEPRASVPGGQNLTKTLCFSTSLLRKLAPSLVFLPFGRAKHRFSRVWPNSFSNARVFNNFGVQNLVFFCVFDIQLVQNTCTSNNTCFSMCVTNPGVKTISLHLDVLNLVFSTFLTKTSLLP
jgi:hypothetical protein